MLDCSRIVCMPRCLAALVIVTAPVAWAQQAPPFVCNLSSTSAKVIREGGLAEAVADLTLTCTGGVTGTPTPKNIQVFFNTNYTGRSQGIPLSDGTTVYPGRAASANSVIWTVPFSPPGSGEFLTLSMSQLRVRALAQSGSIIASVAITGASGVPSITNPNIVVGVGLLGSPLTIGIRRPDDSGAFTPALQSCNGNNPTVTANTTRDFNIKFTESQAEVFQEASGIETQNTRLLARFIGVPAGVNIYVTVAAVPIGAPVPVTAALTATDANGAGPLLPVRPTNGPYAQLPVVGGTAMAIWDVTNASDFVLDSLSFGVVISFAQNAPTGTINLRAGLGPYSTDATASDTAPIPRYLDTSTPMAAAAIVACQAAALAITTRCPLPDGALGALYNQVLAATGGTPPYTWSVDSGALPGGLSLAPGGRVSGTPTAAGTFAVRFRVNDSGRASATIDCAIGIRGSFQTSISAITFSGPSGGSVPPSQVLSLTSDEAGAPFSIKVDYGTGAPFLQLSSVAGTMPAAVSVGASTANFAGVQRATLTIDSPGATPPTKVVTVTFNVGAAVAPGLGIAPAGFLVSTPRNAAVRNRILFITNKGSGRISFAVSASTLSGGPWLGVSPAGGSVGPNERFYIVVSFQSRQVPVGAHRGIITISSPETGERLTANATLAVGPAADALAIAPEGMTFYAVTGQDGVPPQPLRVISDGAGVINWQAAISYPGSPPGWLTLSQMAGATRPGSASEIQASVNPRVVPAGVHTAIVDFTAAGAENSPRSVLVVLNTLGAGEDPGPVIQPGGLMFVSGGADPTSQTIVVYNVSTRTFTFTPVLTGDPAIFDVTTPQGRTVDPGARAAITVAVKAGAATQGVTRAALSLQFTNDPKVRVLDLVLIRADGATPTVAVRREANGCTPERLEIVSVFPYRLNYTVAAGPPVVVSAIVRDNCGELITDETAFVVTARPSTDLAPRLLRAASGFWTGDLVFRSTPSATITIDATNLSGSLKGTYTIGSATNADLSAPIVADGGVTSGASFIPFGPLAGGGIITVFGEKLADTTVSAPALPLPQRLGGADLAVGGRVVPLFFASDGQVNGVLPFGADLYGTRQLVVRRTGGLPRLVEVNIRQAQPAIFILNQAVFRCDQAAVLDLQGRVPSSGSPCIACQPPQQCAPPIVAVTVARGEFISIFAEGLGPVNGAYAAGTGAPALPITGQIAVRIGGADVAANDVQYGGLAPGFASLYQVNARVPMNSLTGDAVPVEISVDGVTSNVGVIAVR